MENIGHRHDDVRTCGIVDKVDKHCAVVVGVKMTRSEWRGLWMMAGMARSKRCVLLVAGRVG